MPAIGDIVVVRFLDHCHGGKKPLECKAYGRIVRNNATFISVEAWHPTDESIDEDREDNTDVFHIVSSTIQEITILQGT